MKKILLVCLLMFSVSANAQLSDHATIGEDWPIYSNDFSCDSAGLLCYNVQNRLILLLLRHNKYCDTLAIFGVTGPCQVDSEFTWNEVVVPPYTELPDDMADIDPDVPDFGSHGGTYSNFQDFSTFSGAFGSAAFGFATSCTGRKACTYVDEDRIVKRCVRISC